MPGNFKLADGRPCPYCARPMVRRHPTLQPTRDHVVPQSLGGKVIVICCLGCNAIKADLPPLIWSAFMIALPEWWRMPKYLIRSTKNALLAAGAPEGTPPLEVTPAPVYRRLRQGEEPPAPIVVPPALIWSALQRARSEVAELVPEGAHAPLGLGAHDGVERGHLREGGGAAGAPLAAWLDDAVPLDPDDGQDDDYSVAGG